MQRIALEKLIEWNNKKKRKPLVVYGARQIGKTFLLKDIFAETYYKGKYLYIDFKKDDEARTFINGGANGAGVCDAKAIISHFEYRERMKISSETLLIFDEVQEALPILTSLKYFKQDFPEIPVLASGSMVRMKIKRATTIANQRKTEGFFFPVGAIWEFNLYPVTFEEFILNYDSRLYEEIKKAYAERRPMDEYLHKLALNALYHFLLVGSMPENVQSFLDGDSLIDIKENTEAIFNNYLNDMELYQASPTSIVRSKMVFSNIYSQLAKESKDFRPSLLEKDLKTRDVRTPVDWLVTAHVVHRSFETSEVVTTPLKEKDESNYRLYLLDNGLLAHESDMSMLNFVDPAHRNDLSGVFFENYVACELIAKGFKLFYWKGKRGSEFEFLIEDDGQIVPIDAKKGRGDLHSLDAFRNHNSNKKAIKVSANNFGVDETKGVVTIPLYMFFAYLNEVNEKKRGCC